MHEEEQHIDVREKLLNLPKVKASDDFMNSLQRKINLSEDGLNQKKISDDVKESVWVKLFGKNRNPWLIPSLSLTILAVLVVSIYVLNSGKLKEVPSMSDFQKKDSPSCIVPDIKSQKEESKEKSLEKDIPKDVIADSKKNSETKTSDLGKEIFDDRVPKISSPPVEREMMKLSEPLRSKDAIEETGKIEYKKEEKVIMQELEKKVTEETIIPAESNVKGDEVNQKIKSDESRNGDVIEKKGLIEKKDKSAMRKAVKTATDSTKIDKKALEKIKEEIQKDK